jgi:hypothetical protein
MWNVTNNVGGIQGAAVLNTCNSERLAVEGGEDGVREEQYNNNDCVFTVHVVRLLNC